MQNAEGRECDTWSEYRLDIREFGIHTSGEEDDGQSYHADNLRVFIVIKLDTQAIYAKQHSYEQEHQKYWNAESIARLAQQYADEPYHGSY